MSFATYRQSFRHDKRGSQVVEIRREEYERSKQAILQKIRRRLVILGVVVGLLSLASLILGGVSPATWGFCRSAFLTLAPVANHRSSKATS